MINFNKTKYILSAPDISFSPNKNNLKEILFVGKSNVGKSSLLNSICSNSNLAKVSKTPGFTKYLNYFLVDDNFYIIDAPGYGFTLDRGLNFTSMMESIFKSENLKAVIFLLDSRHKLTDYDKVFYNSLIDKNLPFIVVLTKSDKINQKEKASIIKDIKTNFKIIKDNEIIFTSALKKDNINKVKEAIAFFINKK